MIWGLLWILPVSLFHLLITDGLWNQWFAVLPDNNTLKSQLIHVSGWMLVWWIGLNLWIFFDKLLRRQKHHKPVSMSWNSFRLARFFILILLALQFRNLFFQWPAAAIWLADPFSPFQLQFQRWGSLLAGLIVLRYWVFPVTVKVRIITLLLPTVVLLSFSGSPSAMVMGMARYLESTGRYEQSLKLYGFTLEHSGSPAVRSWVQYHSAFLYLKTGQRSKALRAFEKVVLEFSWDATLADKAALWHRNLSKSKGLDRNVLSNAGRTGLQKSAYCVPNSLEQIIRYKGGSLTAAEIGTLITRTGDGSNIADAVYMMEMKGYKMPVLTGGNVELAHKLINLGYPILVFHPGHAVVIFGYDVSLQSLIVYDIDSWEVLEDVSATEFQRRWNGTAGMFALLLDADQQQGQSQELDDILGVDWEHRSESILQYLIANRSELPSWAATRFLARSACEGNPHAQAVMAAEGHWISPCKREVWENPAYYEDSIYTLPGVGHERLRMQMLSLLQYNSVESARAFLDRVFQEKQLSWQMSDDYLRMILSKGDTTEFLQQAPAFMDEDGYLAASSLWLLAQLQQKQDPQWQREILEQILLREGYGTEIQWQAWQQWVSLVLKTGPLPKDFHASERNLLRVVFERHGCMIPQAASWLLQSTESLSEERDWRLLRERASWCRDMPQDSGID